MYVCMYVCMTQT